MSIKGYLDLSYPQVAGVGVIHIQGDNPTGLVSSEKIKLLYIQRLNTNFIFLPKGYPLRQTQLTHCKKILSYFRRSL
jgi:hypothetical protein